MFFLQITVCQVSEGYRTVEEVGAVHFHQVVSKFDFMEPSYGPKKVLSSRVLNERLVTSERIIEHRGEGGGNRRKALRGSHSLLTHHDLDESFLAQEFLS